MNDLCHVRRRAITYEWVVSHMKIRLRRTCWALWSRVAREWVWHTNVVCLLGVTYESFMNLSLCTLPCISYGTVHIYQWLLSFDVWRDVWRVHTWCISHVSSCMYPLSFETYAHTCGPITPRAPAHVYTDYLTRSPTTALHKFLFVHTGSLATCLHTCTPIPPRAPA